MKLPQYVRYNHGAYFYVRWNPVEKKVTWIRLGKGYPEMLHALAHLEDSKITLMRDIIERYRAEISEKQSANTRRQRDWQLNNLVHSFGNMIPSAVSPQLIYKYHDDRSRTAPVAANREVSLLCGIFAKAIRWGYLSNNPARALEKNKERPRDRYVTDDEYHAVLKQAPRQVALAMRLAYLTGQRFGDLVSLRWSQVDGNGVHFVQAKTGKKLVFSYTSELQKLLGECREGTIGSMYVLADRKGQPWHQFTLGSAFRRTVAKCIANGALKERFTFHDLRAKAASDTDGKLLGHANTRTLERVYKRKEAKVRPVK
ncbi:MAG: tyrosine-type recombinase/integrase [Gammaproteobacteria bacterium]